VINSIPPLVIRLRRRRRAKSRDCQVAPAKVGCMSPPAGLYSAGISLAIMGRQCSFYRCPSNASRYLRSG